MAGFGSRDLTVWYGVYSFTFHTSRMVHERVSVGAFFFPFLPLFLYFLFYIILSLWLLVLSLAIAQLLHHRSYYL
ncbi:hypothetical protein ASPBRDRAFT_512926 [Aspergillus brasiliensis CBS 101740]|uniref:Uncharacterized protein n=1 Tax=Aspergillus brasiliensis (strain CBS 101740 / IMI 381727 / IBT 21946) TaxID=767769 RepID=A0A1L9UPK6_ASPBC|nr:hypothetical protein ASPBRDRAFT_512926 [Aspergillus brasiliensis CBS 101740]